MKNRKLLWLRLGLIFFLGIFLWSQSVFFHKVLAQEASQSGEMVVSMSSAERRRGMALKNEVKKNYRAGEKIETEFYNEDGNKFEMILTDNQGNKINSDFEEETIGGVSKISLNPPLQFRPGKYKLVIEDQTGSKVEQDFWWGVLAINPNKSVYYPGEKAELAMAVLNDKGAMVCDAKLSLKITKASGEVEELSTENGLITVNPECLSKEYTENADYQAEFINDTEGIYQMELRAETSNGNYQINDKYEVKKRIDYEIERKSATRIFPVNEYPMEVVLMANQDFEGKVYEIVPKSFEIKEINQVGIKNYDEVYQEDNDQKIEWQLKLKRGDKVTLGYRYKAPNISPQFYLSGPLTMMTLTDLVYTEARQWQIAADDVTTMAGIRQEINIIDGPITTGGTNAALINLDTSKYNGATYFFEIIANKGSGTTLTVNLSTGNTNTVGIGISNTSNVLVRKQFTPENGSFDYRLNLTTGTTPTVKVARVIILQSAVNIHHTETQIEIGNLEVGLSFATTTPLSSPKYWKYDSSVWDTGTTFYAEIVYGGIGITGGSQTFTTAGSNTFTAPMGISSVKAEVWGGGGAGGGQNTSSDGGGGGGGGAYSNKLSVAVNGGTGYTAFVGIGGTGKASSKGGNGQASYFINASTVMAAGGTGGSPSTGTPPAGGLGGAASVGVGDTKWSGGQGEKGRDSNTGQGGYGGSSAGVGTTGWSGPQTWSTITYPTANTPSGGGHGGNGGGAGVSGSAPASGNGGGGGGSGDGSLLLGGNGASGKVVISWATIPPTVSLYLQEDNGSFASWTNKVTLGTGLTGVGPIRVRSSSFTPTDGRHYRIAAYNSGSGTYDIYNAKIIADQIGGQDSYTYYFNASDVGTTDSNNTWTNDTNAFDSDTTPSTYAYTSTENSAYYLKAEGTNAPSSGTGTITGVEARIYGEINLPGNPRWSSYKSLSTPTGGWTWQTINDLEVKLVVWDEGGCQRLDANIYSNGLTQLLGTPAITYNYTSHVTREFRAYKIEVKVNVDYGGSNIEKLEPQYLMLNTKSTTTGSTLGYQTLWDSSEWNRTTNIYKHAQDAVGAVANAKIRDITASTDVTNSSITGANQVIGAAMTMPTSGDYLDTWLVATGTEVDTSRILVQTTIEGIVQNISQNYYLWRDDTNGLDSYGGFLESENVGITGVVKGSTIRLRIEAANIGETLTTMVYRLEYGVKSSNCGSGETYVAVPVTPTTEAFEMVTSTCYTNGDNSTASPLTNTGTFVTGKGVADPSNQTASIVLTDGYYTEVEYAIAATSNAINSGSYCFRLSNAGSTTNFTYSVYPEVTLSAGTTSATIIKPNDWLRHGAWFKDGVRQVFTF